MHARVLTGITSNTCWYLMAGYPTVSVFAAAALSAAVAPVMGAADADAAIPRRAQNATGVEFTRL